MEYMHKIFYNLAGRRERKEKLKERLDYDSILKPNLKITPLNQDELFQLYYIPTMKTIDLINSISKDDIILVSLYEKLPPLAKKAFFIDMISSELKSTNDLEGIKTDKEELVYTTKKLIDDSSYKEKMRFSNVINSYLELEKDNLNLPLDSKDIRKIYNQVALGEIDKKNLPDGKYFRKGPVYIKKNNKIIHTGVEKTNSTEEYIIVLIERLLNFINQEDKYNSLIKNAIFHYYFSYIHPFYDGNGRTNRFISSIYLKKDYSWLTALSLAQGSNEYRHLYLKAFDNTNQFSMQGELNFFVDSFLEILNLGQNILKENLENKIILLESSIKKVKADKRINNDSLLVDISNMAIELHLFSFNDYIDIKTLEKHFGYSNQSLRSKLNYLVDLKILKKISKNPIKCVVNESYLES